MIDDSQTWVMKRCLVLSIAAVLTLTLTSSPADAGTSSYPYEGAIPEWNGVEFNELFTDSLRRLPGLHTVSASRLYIFGTSRDDLIYQVQFARGYQLRPEADAARLVGTGSSAMQPEMAQAWDAMRAAASLRGWNLSVWSAFRSVDVQRSIAQREYRNAYTWSEIDAVARWHSVPGTSKHHTGYTLDIGYAGRKLQSYDAAYQWLTADNYAVAKSYGFIPSYPPDGGKQGPNPEPWEWNWIGVDNLINGRVNLCPSGADCDTIVLQDSAGRFHFWSGATSGVTSSVFYYGVPGDIPFSGDWNCDGVETLGLYRRSDGFVYLRNSNTEGVADISFYFGIPGDYPVAGDFNGDGCDTVSIYRPSEARFYIINRLGSNGGGLGSAEYSFLFGVVGDKPFVGDFNADQIDTIGLHRESNGLVYFRNSNTTGVAEFEFFYGIANDKLVAGDWDGDGDDTVGVYRPSKGMLYLRNSNTQGVADAWAYAGSYTGVVAIDP